MFTVSHDLNARREELLTLAAWYEADAARTVADDPAAASHQIQEAAAYRRRAELIDRLATHTPQEATP